MLTELGRFPLVLLAAALLGVVAIFGACDERRNEVDRLNALIDASLAGPTLGSYPPGTDDAIIIRALRSHLERVAEAEPDAEVLAVVFLHRALSPEQFIGFADRYRLATGEQATILVSTGQAVIADSLHARHFEPGGLLAFLTAGPPEHRGGSAGDISVEGFAAYSTTTDLLRLWSEQGATVRGIGVVGKRGNLVAPWGQPRPGEPLR